VSDRWEDALAIEKLNLLYTQSYAGFLATIANAGILVFLLWGLASPAGLGSWFAYVVSITLARFLLVSWYHQQPRASEETARWRARFLVGVGAAGLGWGLAICREIVAAHEGKIWVENAPEGGAIFFVELPVPERVTYLITSVGDTPQIAA
jgi:putative flippase GtrA